MNENRDPGAQPDDTQPTAGVNPEAAFGDQPPADPGSDQVAHEAYSPVPPPPTASSQEPPARLNRFSALLTGGRRTIAAAAIAALLLVGAGATGFALAAGDSDGNDNGNGRDRSSQDRDGGRDRGDGNDNDATDAAAATVDEEPLTGTVLAQVAKAVEAEYPGAVIERAETDADGVYEAHVTTAAGDDITVELDAQFAVTGTEDN